ncbi:MAG: glycosyltransferase family 1 protein [Bacteroidota bacterium]
MVIAVNTRLLIKNKLEGIGWFTYETLSRITKLHPEHTFYFIFDRPYHSDFVFGDNVIPVVLHPKARHPFLFVIWFEISVTRFLAKLKPDLFLSPDGYLSLLTKTKSLAVIHDINFEHYPKDLPWIIEKYYRFFFPRFAQKASRIATVSEFSKQDIVAEYNINKSKIDVVYNGSNENYYPLTNSEKELTRAKYTQGKQFFVFVGALLPRKNLTNLFFAFEQFRQKTGHKTALVIVGEKKWWTSSIEQAYSNISDKNSIIFTGRLDPIELNKVLSASVALTYVSYFEGFGIPIIEAFRCGTAVITSNVTSMPEVAGDAAILVDPFSVDEIAEALQLLIENQDYRDQLIQKGTIQLSKFSWDKSAELLWKSIEKTINKE